MLLGHARGKVGSLVFSRLKGQQVTRARNFSPANPRTSSQMYQRALFADAVKFYTRGRQKLYQFAFEDKKANESDYNAFMRNNTKRGVVISKAGFDNYDYPAIGNWIISKGSLKTLNYGILESDGMPYLGLGQHAAAEELPTTLGAVSSAIIDGEDILTSDILTFVSIEASPSAPNVEGEASFSPKWQIKQIQLDPTSTQPLSDYGLVVVKYGAGDTILWQFKIASTDAGSNSLFFGAVVLSRNTNTGTKVSTTELAMNVAAETALDNARKRSYIDAVIESWRTTQQAPVVSEAIMQGSIAQSIALDFEPAGE